MAMLFNSILTQEGIEPSETILVRHQDMRAEKGRTPFELWRFDRPAFDAYQTHQNPDRRSRFQRATYWASFVATPAGETLFAGVYRAAYVGLLDHDRPKPHMPGVDEAGSCDVYRLEPLPAFDDLAGRLTIEWGDGARAWIQRAELQNKPVAELRQRDADPEFPGFLNFMSPLSQIEALPLTWIATFKASRGIYLLTCPKTREQYVGMAAGQSGFWGRWIEYKQTGHGGNVALKSRDPADYQISVLEVAGTAATDADIAAMETRWKLKLQSRDMGLNRN
ncbi:MAG: GIY-YIG nuclease family protein [Rhizomicrobium sp.]